jgi:hypothetical protein
MTVTPTPIRRHQPLGQTPAAVRVVDRVIHQPDRKRRPQHPTFNSAV